MAIHAPREIVETVVRSAGDKARLPVPRYLALAFLGGAYIALGALLSLVVGGGFPAMATRNPVWPKLLMGAVFPVGLMMVAIAGAELFTGNTAYFSAARYARRISPSGLLRNWALVYAGNFVGALFVAFLAYSSGVLAAEPWRSFAAHLGEVKTSADLMTVFWKGVACNWFVAVAMWQATAAKDVVGKVIGVWFPVMAFVTLGFEHCVANMFFLPVAMALGAPISPSDALLHNLLPATLGNIVGGGLLVGALYAFIYRPQDSMPPIRGLEELPEEAPVGIAGS
jgi:formate/nitrite transporter